MIALRKAAFVMRWGVLGGLALLIIGILIEYLTGVNTLITAGLAVIAATPPTALAFMAYDLLRRGDREGFFLSLIMLATVLVTATLMLMKQ